MSTAEDNTGGASGTAEHEAAGLLGSEVREGYAEVGDQRLHYVEAGEGPLIVLLHGSPSFGTAGGSRSSRSRRRALASGIQR